MKYLLDTHTLIWLINGDIKLSKKALETIELSTARVVVSVVSFWEIAIKVSLGKLELTLPFSEIINKVNDSGFGIMGITFDHTLQLSQLPFHHRDPFDRTLIAQTLSEDLVIISKEKLFDEYNVKRIWD